jgi:WG containing repeat
MKQLSFLFVFLLPVFSSAQFFKKTSSGLELYSDSALTTRVGAEVYDQCWCKPVYSKKDSTLLYLAPKINAKNYFAVSKNNVWGGINATGKTVEQFTFDGPFEERKSGHFNVFHNLKDTLNQLKYQIETTITRMDSTLKVDTSFYVMDEYKGSYLVSYDKIKFGIINSDFKILLPLTYESVYYKMPNFRFNPSGLLTLENSLDKCGAVNYLGKTVVSFNYQWITDYVWNDNYIFVQNDKKKGFVNSSNQIVVPMRYEKLPEQLTSKNLVADENYIWYVNEKFEIISPKYQALDREGNVIFFKLNSKWGVMDLQEKIIVPNVYTAIEYGPRLKSNPDFKCYYAVKNGKYGMISLANEIIIPFEYECLCGLAYYAPDNYYIEFKKGTTLYRFDSTGKLIEKVVGEGKACLCEMQSTE